LPRVLYEVPPDRHLLEAARQYISADQGSSR
jgi:hypothetical protein